MIIDVIDNSMVIWWGLIFVVVCLGCDIQWADHAIALVAQWAYRTDFVVMSNGGFVDETSASGRVFVPAPPTGCAVTDYRCDGAFARVR